jgi:malonate decarboxylase beta subunit
MGGKHRRLLGAADVFADDTVQDFREAALELLELLDLVGTFGLDRLKAEHERLADRLRRFGACEDAVDIWTAEGVAHAATVPELPADQFIALANRIGRTSRDAR